MSQTAEKKVQNTNSPSRTNFGPGERPLYFNNRGLFSDPFLAHHLPDLESRDTLGAGERFLSEFWNWPDYEGSVSYNELYNKLIGMWDEKKGELPDLNEAQLEEEWIKPIFNLLGWSYVVQDGQTRRGRRNIPDYSMFAASSEISQARKTKTDEAYNRYLLAVADAKAWKVALDGIGRSNNNPSYQIVRYMEHTDVPWAILTNGRNWRIYSLRSNVKHATYFEIDLESLLTKRNDERFKYFFNFFRKDAFVKSDSSAQSFLDVVFEEGVYYAKDVEANLKKRVFEVVENIAKGFAGDRGELSEHELKTIYDHSLYYLFRLMFILNCESKGLLALDQTKNYYEYSLRRQITRLKEKFDENHTWSNQARTYRLIESLFELLADGDERIGVHGFGKEIFASGSDEFYTKNQIPDFYLNVALVQLACDYSDGEDGSLQFIDYKRLSEEHLGTLFEGLLEYELKYAAEKLAVTDKGKIEPWSSLSERRKKQSLSLIQKGELYLSSGSGDRKSTGSYYTPPYIVDTLLEGVLADLCSEKTPDQIFEMKICDPAMGSGHFLIGVVRRLENIIQEYVYMHEVDIGLGLDEIKWKVLAGCIYGVDINPLAVELSKFSLWMYTARRGDQLERLSDQLKCGDSMVDSYDNYSQNFNWQKEFFNPKGFDGFDVIVGNPPWDTVKPKLTDFYKSYTNSSKSLKRKDLDEWIEARANRKAKEAYLSYEAETLRYSRHLKDNAGYKYQEGESQKHSILTERAIGLLRKRGRLAFVTKLGFYSDKFQTKLRDCLYRHNRVVSMMIFQKNRLPEGLVFQSVDPNEKFLLLVVEKGALDNYEFNAKFVVSRGDINCNFDKWMRYSVPEDVDDDLNFIEVYESQSKAALLNTLKVHKSIKHHGIKIFRELDATTNRDVVTRLTSDVPVFVGEDIGRIRRNPPSLYCNLDDFSAFRRIADKKIGVRNILPNSRRKIYAAILPPGCLTQNSVLCLDLKSTVMPHQYILCYLNCYIQEYFIGPKLSNLNLNNFRLEMFRIPDLSKNPWADRIIETIDKVITLEEFKYDESECGAELEAMALLSLGVKSEDDIIARMYESFKCSKAFIERVMNVMDRLEEKSSTSAACV